jgi:hypothetical protein
MAQLLTKKKDDEQDQTPDPTTVGKRILPDSAMGMPVGKVIDANTPSDIGTAAAPPDPSDLIPKPPEKPLMTGAGLTTGGPLLSGGIMSTPAAPSVDPDVALAQSKLSALNQQGRPVEHGWRKALDTLAASTSIGRAIEANSGLGTVGYDAARERAQYNLDKATGTAKENQALRNTQSEIEARNYENEPVDVGNGVTILRKNMSQYETGMGRVGASQEANTIKLRSLGYDENGIAIPDDLLSEQEISKINMNRAHEQLMGDQGALARSKMDPKSPVNAILLQRLALSQQNYDLRRKEYGFKYDPSILTSEERSQVPTTPQGTPIGFANPLRPGASAVSAAERAQNVVDQLPRIQSEIQELSSTVGPIAGRWNQFWQGDVGVAAPKFAHLLADSEYLASAVALAHAYGRLPSSISDKFDKLYQAGKQDPKNMLAAMEVAMEWLPKIVQRASTTGEQDNAKGGGAGGGRDNNELTPAQRWQQQHKGQ